MADKPDTKPVAPKSTPASNESDPGRLAVDDRGNVTWEWKDDGDLLADDSLGAAERLRALVDPRLNIVEDDGAPGDPLKPAAKSRTTGYNPYNSGARSAQPSQRRKNLKELSKWIELRKKLAGTKDEEP